MRRALKRLNTWLALVVLATVACAVMLALAYGLGLIVTWAAGRGMLTVITVIALILGLFFGTLLALTNRDLADD